MSIIYLPFSYIMKACVWIAQNSYLFGLLFYALAFWIILFPLAIKQQKSQIKMASIKPKELAIRSKYAGRTDRVTQQKMQQEIQEMYTQQGYSPLSGCLPMLIQLPLIFILYAIVRYPIQYSSSFDDISKKDIIQIVTEEHEDIKDTDGFNEIIVQYAFDYVEDIRTHLHKGNDAAINANTALLDCLKTLGATEVKDGEETVKLENGFVSMTRKKGTNTGNQELGVADIFANYGESYVQSLQKDGALDDSYDPSKYPLSYKRDGEVRLYADEMPNFSFLGINMLKTPSFSNLHTLNDWVLLLIPILVFLTSFFQTKITRKFQPMVGPNGEQQGGGLFLTVGMPLMSAVFTLMFPAAIGAYWVWRTLFTMVQPIILHKLYPIPVVSQEEIDAAMRELKSTQKKKKVITIEVDEDDDSYADLEVKGINNIERAAPKTEGRSGKQRADLPYRQPTKIEMLSAEEDEPSAEEPKGE